MVGVVPMQKSLQNFDTALAEHQPLEESVGNIDTIYLHLYK